jgi:hypothetical protein
MEGPLKTGAQAVTGLGFAGLANGGTVTTPTAGQEIVGVTVAVAGVYDIGTSAGFGATADIGTNVGLYISGEFVGLVPCGSGVNSLATVGVALRRFIPAGARVSLRAQAAGGAGAIYNAFLFVNPHELS